MSCVSAVYLSLIRAITDEQINSNILQLENNLKDLQIELDGYGEPEGDGSDFFHYRLNKKIREGSDQLSAYKDEKYRRMPCEYQI